ncbi:hypothetical protein C2W62_04315 [Candidatus Entotheonella serta]|nr:hypothetical protein C2W62_04315 [Candidatus Entotheonella serta]
MQRMITQPTWLWIGLLTLNLLMGQSWQNSAIAQEVTTVDCNLPGQPLTQALEAVLKSTYL